MKLKAYFGQFDNKEMRNAYLFLLPILVVIIMFVFIPVVNTFINSLYHDISHMPPTRFVGFRNYSRLLRNEDFWSAMGFTMLVTITAVAFEAVIGMVFALLLNEEFKFRGVLRTVILIPWAIPTIVSAKMWQFMYDFQYGILNWLLMRIGMERVNWIGTADAAFWAIIIAELWKTTPFIVIIVLSGLQAIPRDLYKQAKIDGCGMFRTFWKITLPLVWPVLMISLIFRTIDTLRIFDLVYALTGGGPAGSTETLSTLGYSRFIAAANFGMGSTTAIVTFIVAFAIALVYIKVGKFSQGLK